jgi:hypothetical protein
MRPFPRFALCIIIALGASGCTLVAQIGGSSVVNADEHGGTVAHVTTFTLTGALNMAGSWCGQYGLYAVETRVIFATDSMDFACVPPPQA